MPLPLTSRITREIQVIPLQLFLSPLSRPTTSELLEYQSCVDADSLPTTWVHDLCPSHSLQREPRRDTGGIKILSANISSGFTTRAGPPLSASSAMSTKTVWRHGSQVS